MSLTLHFHPLSSFCHKALIALYENDTPFEQHIVNLMDPAEAAAFKAALAVRSSFRCCRTAIAPSRS